MERYPTENGIALSPYELWLPGSKKRGENNHHAHFTRKKFEQTAATLALRNLARHQYVMPVDIHNFLHDTYAPPELPTEDQAAKEVIDAYESGEQFKIYNKHAHRYDYRDIPPELVDGFIAKHGLKRVFVAAHRLEGLAAAPPLPYTETGHPLLAPAA